jgi:ferrous iron transport protein B
MTQKQTIAIFGNPNVGKSTLFSHLTGVHVVASNYPGTTVEFKQGDAVFKSESYTVVDVPGTYSLSGNNDAEESAVTMLDHADYVINIIDATNLERNLLLTYQLMQKKIPMIVALNFVEEAHHKGIVIDAKRLAKRLGVPVVPITATTAQGIKSLVDTFHTAKTPEISARLSEKKIWENIQKDCGDVQTINPSTHTFKERLEDMTIKPATGIPIGLIAIVLIFTLIRFVGEGFITYVFDPLFELLRPLLMIVSESISNQFIHDILIGTLSGGEIDFVESMGLLTTGLYVPIAMILPYIVAFYFVLSVFEDVGYLPRLSTLVDSIMHRFGMHGLAIVPMLLGFGCNVPGVFATRILETKRQRFIVTTLTAITVPCMAQLAMIYGLLGSYGIQALLLVFVTLFSVWMVLALIMSRFMKGQTPETFVEIPPIRFPRAKTLFQKSWFRTKHFIKEAIPFVLLGVVIVNVLYVTGIIDLLGTAAEPVVTNVMGLPKETIGSLLVGFLRKDVAVGMLVPLGLTMKEMVIASVVLTMYFPCIATFIVIFKEMGLKDTLKSTAIMLASTLLVAGLLNVLL